MEVLPLELIGIVCDYLDPRDLLRLACCNRDLYFLAEPRLYAKLDILIGPYGVRASSAKLLNIFMLHPHLCRFINRIEVREASPHVCTGDQVMLLQVLVATVLKSVGPTTLRSFTWIIARDADCFFLHGLPDQLTSLTAHGDLLRTIGLFPNLKQLDCGRIGSLEELEWIFWHIQNCSSLRKLRLGFAPGRRLFRIEKSLNFFFSLLHSLQSLEELSLEVIEVRQLKLESFPLLKKLGLKRCVGTGEALLNSIGIAHVRLKALSLAVQDELHHPIAEFITYLASFSPLHELTVLFSGSSSIFPLKSVLLHGSALRLLILDCRVLAGEPTTVWRYSVDHLRLIARSCPLLIALGLPINLGIERVMGSRPRRAEALKHLRPSCRLRILHLRGSYPGGVDVQKAAVDAKHAVRSFLPRQDAPDGRKYVSVHLNHQRQLRVFHVSPTRGQGNRRFAVTQRKSSETELLIDAQWTTQWQM